MSGGAATIKKGISGNNGECRRIADDFISYMKDNLGGIGRSEVNGEKAVQEVSEGVGNPVKVEGRGVTGRIEPYTLSEQMAMEQVKSNPLYNAKKLPFKLKDQRWPAEEGWVKMQSIVENSDGSKTIIHYVYNEKKGLFDDFKFKD